MDERDIVRQKAVNAFIISERCEFMVQIHVLPLLGVGRRDNNHNPWERHELPHHSHGHQEIHSPSSPVEWRSFWRKIQVDEFEHSIRWREVGTWCQLGWDVPSVRYPAWCSSELVGFFWRGSWAQVLVQTRWVWALEWDFAVPSPDTAGCLSRCCCSSKEKKGRLIKRCAGKSDICAARKCRLVMISIILMILW